MESWVHSGEHPWRGNVRELRNAVERALAMAGGGPVEGAEPVAAPTVAISLDQPLIEQRERLVDHFEATHVKAMLEMHEGNFTRASAAAGVDRMCFTRLLRKHAR